MKTRSLAAVIVAGFAGTAFAFDFDESIDGDLSDDRFNTSQFTLDLGSNIFRMQVVDSNNFVNGDIDYLTVTVPAGLQLDSIFLNESSAMGDNRAFIGLAPGEDFPVDPQAPDPSLLTGFVITDNSLVGTNILSELQGFDPSPILGESVQSFWIQQTGFDLTQLEMQFNVSEIPAPGAASLFGAAALAAARRRR